MSQFKKTAFKYDVAFSFAEEDRDFVDRVAAQLKGKGIDLYYDDHERINIWGKDLSIHLNEVYRTDARFCVMFISTYYKKKRWTKYEAQWATARAFFMENKEYILPFRLDNAEIPGLRDTIAYLSVETYDEQRLAQAIIDKIEQGKRKRFLWLQPIRNFFSDRRYITLTGLALLALPATDISLYAFSGRSTISARLLEQWDLRNKWHFKAVCLDSTFSQNNSSGACSHHGGIARRIDTVIYGENLEACKKKMALHHNP